ncbi:MAG TPA: DUF1365 domain-containing protein [Solirubrobacteraceae bacterium]|nr:DUF1365 domain-containing protein [Solirubrobacteraceae bacterium]
MSGLHRQPGAREASCLYEGTVVHRRLAPRRQFRHRVSMVYIDLAELPGLLDGRLLRRSPGALRFRRSDYHGDPRTDLSTAVRDTVERQLGVRPAGPIRLLTTLRSFGVCFNPVSFYYCFDDGGKQLVAVLAEVTNTPWGERHAYALPGGGGRLDKRLHVSPFMPMDQMYEITAAAPADRLAVAIENHRAGTREFVASLALERIELSPATVRRMSARYPVAALRTLGFIYGHALALRLAGVRAHPHPQEARYE